LFRKNLGFERIRDDVLKKLSQCFIEMGKTFLAKIKDVLKLATGRSDWRQ
jgi:hypothetical protein